MLSNGCPQQKRQHVNVFLPDHLLTPHMFKRKGEGHTDVQSFMDVQELKTGALSHAALKSRSAPE